MTAQKRIFAAVLLTSFMGPFLGSCINIAIPTIAVEFSCPATDLSWLATAFLLGAVALLLPFGRMADILGRCRIYAIGTAAMAAVSFVAAFSPSVSFLIAMRALQGLSLGLVFSSGMALLVAAHPAKQRGRAIGYSAAATYVGLSLGPVIGGLVTQHLDWRLLFVLTSIVILVSSLLVRTIKEDWYGEREGGFDLPGAVFYTAASTLTLYGLSSLAAFPWMRFVLLAGLIFLALFLWQERRASTPLLHLSLFANTVFAMSNLAAFLNYSATYAIGFLLSLYLQLVRGLDASTAGVVLLLQPLMMAILSPIAGALSDKHEPRLVASFGMALTTALLALRRHDAASPHRSCLRHHRHRLRLLLAGKQQCHHGRRLQEALRRRLFHGLGHAPLGTGCLHGGRDPAARTSDTSRSRRLDGGTFSGDPPHLLLSDRLMRCRRHRLAHARQEKNSRRGRERI